jgi:hypothetical protein
MFGRNVERFTVSRNSAFRPYGEAARTRGEVAERGAQPGQSNTSANANVRGDLEQPVRFGGPRSNFARVTDHTPVQPRYGQVAAVPEVRQSKDKKGSNSMNDL